MIGIDEVGRGAWAGPLLVCAARLTADVAGLADSKKLTKARREALFNKLQTSSDIGYGWVSAAEIDAIGLSAALKLGAERAIAQLAPTIDEEIIIDGNVQLLPKYPQAKTLVRADALVPCVSAASIAAKVTRDNHMASLAATHTGYGFEHHVGYGTTKHTEAIKLQGYCAEHRRSFRLPEPV